MFPLKAKLMNSQAKSKYKRLEKELEKTKVERVEEDKMEILPTLNDLPFTI